MGMPITVEIVDSQPRSTTMDNAAAESVYGYFTHVDEYSAPIKQQARSVPSIAAIGHAKNGARR